MSKLGRSGLSSEYNALLPTNNNEEISAADEREVADNFNDSKFNLTDDGFNEILVDPSDVSKGYALDYVDRKFDVIGIPYFKVEIYFTATINTNGVFANGQGVSTNSSLGAQINESNEGALNNTWTVSIGGDFGETFTAVAMHNDNLNSISSASRSKSVVLANNVDSNNSFSFRISELGEDFFYSGGTSDYVCTIYFYKNVDDLFLVDLL